MTALAERRSVRTATGCEAVLLITPDDEPATAAAWARALRPVRNSPERLATAAIAAPAGAVEACRGFAPATVRTGKSPRWRTP